MGQSEKGMRERMLAGELYVADDPELARDSVRAQRLTHQINTMDPTDHQRRRELLTELLGAFGEGSEIRPPQLLPATHPLEPGPRRAKWEAAEPIVVGDNVWLGGGVIVCPGVTIGADTVVGAGSVVVRDLPAGVVAVGSPARVVRAL
jgi:maltose O-acetyltransferase